MADGFTAGVELVKVAENGLKAGERVLVRVSATSNPLEIERIAADVGKGIAQIDLAGNGKGTTWNVPLSAVIAVVLTS